jgi:hypothetical protein
MGTYLDIIGAAILAGLLTLSLAAFMAERQAAIMESSNQSIAQIQLESASSLMMYDLRKMGYLTAAQPVLLCSQKAITFLGDIDNNGVVDTVRYTWTGAVPSTPNPNDTLLVRRINSQLASSSDLGITNLRFVYIDKNGSETTTASMVKAVQVRMVVQSRYPVDSVYQQASCDLRISPKNVK